MYWKANTTMRSQEKTRSNSTDKKKNINIIGLSWEEAIDTGSRHQSILLALDISAAFDTLDC